MATTRRRPWPGRDRVCHVLLVGLLVGYALLLSHFFAPAIIHPDANGYWAQASLFMETGRTWFRPESNAQFIGMHWLVTPGDDVYISRYPPGLAVLVGVVWKVFGWEASVWVNPVLAVLALVGVYLIVRQQTSAAWGLVAVALLALNPPFTVHALTDIAHMPVACCLVWGMYLLLRWSKTGRIGFAFVAGLVLGCIPTLRYADAVMAIGIAAFLLWQVRRVPRVHWHLLAAIGGAAIPIVPLLVRNHLLLGAFWRTGYALTNEQTGFGWEYFRQNAMGYLQLLQGGGLGMVFTLGLIGIAWMLCVRRTRATGLMLAGTAVPLVLVYMAYYWARGIAGQGAGGPGGGVAGAMRFLVPMVAVFVVAGVWAMAEALRQAPRAVAVVVPGVVLAMQGLMSGPTIWSELGQTLDRKTPMVLATRGLEDVARPGDVVIANPQFQQNFEFVRQWKLADTSVIGVGRGMPGGGGARGGMFGSNRDPEAPSPMQMEKNALRAKLYTGGQREKERQFLADVEAWAGDGSVWVVGDEALLDRFEQMVPDELTVMQRIKTPAARATDEEPRRGMGMGFGGMSPGRRTGGPFGPAVAPGADILIARWERH